MKFLAKKYDEFKSKVVIAFCFEDDKRSKLFSHLNYMSMGVLEKQITSGLFSGSYLESFKYAINENLTCILFGLGQRQKLTRKKFSIAVANAVRYAKKIKPKNSIAIELVENIPEILPFKKEEIDESKYFDLQDSAKITLCALRTGLYEFNKYIKNSEKEIECIEILVNFVSKEIERGVEIGAFTSYAMKFAKDLVNEPASVAVPKYICDVAKKIAHDNILELKILNKAQIAQMKMGAYLAVASGSSNEPRFIHLTYKPTGTPRKKIALVGKGITFDSGGFDIKSAQSMLTMKSDMTGVATVLGVIQAVAKLNLDVEVHVISAMCENILSSQAYKPGDVVVAMNGKSIEIDNTDAEGRLTLADALSYCDNLSVDEVIDVATLTGAVVVALGNNITGVLGNNQSQINKFLKISKMSCENAWQMPIFEELKDNLKSEIADFKNTGGRMAGTSTAGWFLSNFTKSASWMHLDIAGTAYLDKSNKETLSGPTGVMVRSLINYLIDC